MKRKIIYIALLTFVLADIGYSFLQHYNTPFDGDMAAGIVPADDVKQILSSPFGLKVFKEKITYPNPNRFFSNWLFHKYFTSVPTLFHKFINPIDSAYLSSALAKTATQIAILFLLVIAMTGSVNIFKINFLLGLALVSPFFQTTGYQYMRIIDSATTYTFFYAIPIVLILFNNSASINLQLFFCGCLFIA